MEQSLRSFCLLPRRRLNNKQSATLVGGDRLSRAQSSDLSGGNTCARWTAALGTTVPLIIQLTADEVIE